MVKYNTSIPAHDYNQPYNCIHINMISMHQDTPIHKVSGVSRILFRGGFKIFLEKLGYLHGAKRHAARGKAPCSAWRSHAFARGVRGHAPPRKFLKMVQFGAF